MIERCKYVAVYGSLREGLHNHCVLGGAKQVAKGFIQDTTLYPYFGNSFPAMSFSGNGSTVVEVYEVEDEVTAGNLDMLEGYPSFYNRKVVPIVNRFGEEFMEAWVYHIDDEELNSLHPVPHGDWMAHKTGEATVF